MKLGEVTVTISFRQLHAQKLSGSQQILLEQWFCKDERILKTGDTLLGVKSENGFDDYVNSGSFPYICAQIILTEPVSQGYVVLGETRFLVVFQDEPTSFPASLSILFNENKVSPTSQEEDDLLIDENFIAPSLLQNSGHRDSEVSSNVNGIPVTKFIGREFRSFLLSPKPANIPLPSSYDESFSVLIAPDELAKAGMFSGDWVSRILF